MGMILEEILLGFHLPLAVLAKNLVSFVGTFWRKTGGTS
jgi:hypothetical protein